MKNLLVFPLALAGQLAVGSAFAQGSGRDVSVLRISGPQLGVRLEEVDGDVVSRLKLREEKGALVVEVLDDSAAKKAGIKKDDVIVRFQGESVLTAAQLTRLVRDVPSGRKVAIDLIRAGAPVKVTATLVRGEWSGDGMHIPELADLDQRLGEKMGKLGDLRFKSREGVLPRTFDFKFNEEGPGGFAMARVGRGRLGITYTEIEGQLATYFKAPGDQAILVNSVVAGSAAEKAGMKAGDLLVKLGETEVRDVSDLQEAVRDLEPGKTSRMTVWRDGKSVDLSVTVDSSQQSKAQPRPLRRPVS